MFYGKKHSKINSFIFSALLILIMCFLPHTKVYAAYYDAGFPLPVTGSPYKVTVLDKYSGGAEHGSYINRYVLGKSTAPNGIVADIAAASGTTVYAVAGGTVITSKYLDGSGNFVVIKHYDGTYSYYGHLSSRAVSQGNSVNAGTVVGYVGMTGSATGYHLHFEWSGHDPYCEFSAKGYVVISPNSAASIYPHTHVKPYFTNLRTANITADDAEILATVQNPSKMRIDKIYVAVQNMTTGEIWEDTIDDGKSDDAYNVLFYLKNHFKALNEATLYNFHFALLTNGVWYNSDVSSFSTADITSPHISDVKIENITENGYDVSCVIQDNSGAVSRVKFLTFTKSTNKDVWGNGSYVNGRWQYHVNAADHNNERGAYQTNIYAFDAAGNNSSYWSDDIIVAPKLNITKQPVNVSKLVGEQTSFALTATGDGLTYQWECQKVGSSNFTPCANGNNSSLSLTLDKSWNNAKVRCVVKDRYGKTVTSNIASISVQNPLKAFTLNITSSRLNVGTSLQLGVTSYTPADTSSNKSAVWSSSNNGVATVSSSGKVTAVGVGKTNINCTIAGITRTCAIEVYRTIPLTGFTLNKSSVSINKGKTVQLSVTSYVPSNTTSSKAAVWKTSNTQIATVTSNGTVKGVGTGTANISCTISGITKICVVKVTNAESTVKVPAKKGTSLTDSKSKAKYKVTSDNKKSPTVKYVKSTVSNAKTISIPSSVKIKGITYKVTEIGTGAHKNNKTVKTVTIGSNVKKIGKEAFYGCTRLTTVNIGSNVTSIGDKAFYGCSSLQTLTLPSSWAH